MKKILVSLSGGMDSATALALALSSTEEKRVEAVHFTYGSKHASWEYESAYWLANHYGVNCRRIEMTSVMTHFKSNLLATGGELPEGHYEDESMKQTVVPARNLIFCSILAGIAASEDFQEVWLGVHAGDYAVYPDCRPVFVGYMQDAMTSATGKGMRLVTPFLRVKKIGILEQGLKLQVPYNLTRTCYSSDRIACGKCGACDERLRAFSLLGKQDPIPYQNRVELQPREVEIIKGPFEYENSVDES